MLRVYLNVETLLPIMLLLLCLSYIREATTKSQYNKMLSIFTSICYTAETL